MNPIVALVLLTLAGGALVGVAAWRLVPPPPASAAGRMGRWVAVALAACSGGVLAADLFQAAHDADVVPRLLGSELLGGSVHTFEADQRAATWFSALGSILFDAVGLLGLAGLVYLVALRRAGARA
jgi:hypothetical protein